MSELRKAAQQALEALDSDHPDIQLRAAITLRAALAQPELAAPTAVEPVALAPPAPGAAARWTEALRAGQMCLVCEHLVCERLVCNLGLDGVVYGYPCTRSDCPNRVTCGGAA